MDSNTVDIGVQKSSHAFPSISQAIKQENY